MAATIPTKEPITIRAGDTIKWTKTLDDYKASDGWTLKSGRFLLQPAIDHLQTRKNPSQR